MAATSLFIENMSHQIGDFRNGEERFGCKAQASDRGGVLGSTPLKGAVACNAPIRGLLRESSIRRVAADEPLSAISG